MEIKRLFSYDPLPVKSSHAFSVVSSTGEPNCTGGPVVHQPDRLNTGFPEDPSRGSWFSVTDFYYSNKFILSKLFI